MTNEVYDALQNILKRRPKIRSEMVVDGYSGFILIDKKKCPKYALHIENECRWAMKKYRKLYPDRPLPKITPHVYRHTFCTNMVNLGMDAKVLQYIMGHSEILWWLSCPCRMLLISRLGPWYRVRAGWW